MSQQRNPRYWASRWYTTKFARKPMPAGWYWHDEHYTWNGPYDSEEQARKDLDAYEKNRRTPVLSSFLNY